MRQFFNNLKIVLRELGFSYMLWYIVLYIPACLQCKLRQYLGFSYIFVSNIEKRAGLEASYLLSQSGNNFSFKEREK